MLISIDVSTFNTQQVVENAINQKIHRLIMPQILKNIQREPKKKKKKKITWTAELEKYWMFSLKPKAIVTEYRD